MDEKLLYLCRLCLLKTEFRFSLFSSNLADKIESLTAIKMTEDDNFPKTCCASCVANVNSAYNFQQCIIDADEKLHEDLQLYESVKVETSVAAEANMDPFMNNSATVAEKPLPGTDNIEANLANMFDTIGHSEALGDEIVKEVSETADELEKECVVDESHLENTKTVFKEGMTGDEEAVTGDEVAVTVAEVAVTVAEVFHDDMEVIEIYDVSDNEELNCDYVKNDKSLLSSSSTRDPVEGHKDEKPANVTLNDILRTHERAFSKTMAANKKPYVKLLSEEEIQKILKSQFPESRQQKRNLPKNSSLANKPSPKKLLSNEDIQIILEKQCVEIEKRQKVQKKMPECVECNLKFESKRLMHQHSMKHKLDACPCCGAMIRRDNLKRHIEMHSAPHEICEICGAIAKNKESLRGHLYHQHNDKHQPKTCEMCNRVFKRKQQYNAHIRNVHLGLREHQCHICGKKFFSNYDVKKHIRMTHDGARPYVCQYCKKGFSSPYARKTHIRQHTLETPYRCELCAEGFRQKVSLVTHMKSKHSVFYKKQSKENMSENKTDNSEDTMDSVASAENTSNS